MASETGAGDVDRSGMIWADVIEEYPDNGYIHPLYDGQGITSRKYRPVWHAIRGSSGRDVDTETDQSEAGQ